LQYPLIGAGKIEPVFHHAMLLDGADRGEECSPLSRAPMA
jgi:hypothetical protein